MSSVYRRPTFALLAALVVVACALAYAPGLHGPFVFDSVERVVRNEALMMQRLDAGELLRAAYAAQATYPQRGLAYVSFAMNYLLAGGRFDAFAFKLTNLLVHLANGVLVFFLARTVVRRWIFAERPSDVSPESRAAYTALIAAALWLLHPIQLTSVLYVVQRMTSLAAFFVFLGAIVFLAGRERLERGAPGAMSLMLAGMVGGAALGFGCKQNALLLPLICGVLELTLFDARALARHARIRLMGLYALALALPLLVAAMVIALKPQLLLEAYRYREFGLVERVLTQPRVLLFYLRLLALPDLRVLGLHHDDIEASSGLLEPWTTLASLVAWAVLIPMAVVAALRRAPWSLGLLWFLAGHALESGVVALELVHEHRNYVPSAGLAMAGAYYAVRLAAGGGARRTLAAVAIAAGMVLALVTGMRAAYWRDPAELMATLARHHPGSYRANIALAFNALPTNADLGIRFSAFQRAAALDDRAVTALVEMAKTAAALEVALTGMDSPDARASDTAPPLPDVRLDVESLRLEADAAAVARLGGLLDAEIRRRLARHVVRTDSVVALVRVVDCMLSRSAYCAGLRRPIREWHLAALGNDRLQRVDRAVLELSLAKVLVAEGELGQAVARARRAELIAPENFSYRVQAAILYAALERWDDLARALEALRRDAPSRGAGLEEILALERRLGEHRSESAR